MLFIYSFMIWEINDSNSSSLKFLFLLIRIIISMRVCYHRSSTTDFAFTKDSSEFWKVPWRNPNGVRVGVWCIIIWSVLEGTFHTLIVMNVTYWALRNPSRTFLSKFTELILQFDREADLDPECCAGLRFPLLTKSVDWGLLVKFPNIISLCLDNMRTGQGAPSRTYVDMTFNHSSYASALSSNEGWFHFKTIFVVTWKYFLFCHSNIKSRILPYNIII